MKAQSLLVAASVWLGGQVFAARARAEDAWASAEPSKQGVRVAISVSEKFPQRQQPVRPDRIESNMLMSAGELSELKPWKVQGAALVGQVQALDDGWHMFQFTTKPQLAVTPVALFDVRLSADGLDAVRRERARLKESDKPGRARSVLIGKTLMRVGGAAEPLPSLAGAGLRYDLVPVTDPTSWRTGDTVEVRATYLGQPALARTVWLVCASGAARASERGSTDAQGVVRLRVPPGRRCLLRSVDMRRLEGDAEAEWETTRTSFTFERVRPGGA